MIVVKIELHSAVTGGVQEIGRMLIANDGSGEGGRGNYDVKVLRRGVDVLRRLDWQRAPTTRTGRVEGFPRHSYNVWRLISRALRSAFPEEK